MMKYLILMTLSVFSFNALAQNDLFEAANKAFQERDYMEAIELYDSISKLGFESPELYYNLGNAHYENGALALAILNYERALIFNPKDEEILHNLRLAEQKRVDRFEAMPPNLFKAFRLGIVRLFSSDQWAYLSIAFLLLAIAGLGFYLFSSFGRIGFISLIGGVLLFGFCLAMAYSHSHYLEEHPRLIIMSDSAYVKSGPGQEAEDLFILHAGTKVEQVDLFETWVKIRLIDGKIGWLPADDLLKIR